MPTTAHEDLERPNIRKLRMDLGFSTDYMGVALDSSSRTIERWERKGMPDEAPMGVYSLLIKLRDLVRLGQEVYGPEAFKRYLRTPLPRFEDRPAFKLVLIGEVDRVMRALATDYEGGGF